MDTVVWDISFPTNAQPIVIGFNVGNTEAQMA